MLKRPAVAAYIQYHREQVSKKIKCSAEWVVEEMFNLAKSNAHDYIRRDGTIINVRDLPRDVAAAIKSIEIDENSILGKKKTKLTLHDKTKNLDNLGRHHNIYKEEKETEGNSKFVTYDVRIRRGPREND